MPPLTDRVSSATVEAKTPTRPAWSTSDFGSTRRFYLWMLLPVGLASLIQAFYLGDVHRTLSHNGDATYYDLQAKLLTEGYWFVNPYDFAWKATIAPSATHPPLTTLFLALVDELGATTWTWHMVTMAIVFVACVLVCGTVGRALAGDRAGIIAAVVVASYPYLWVNPGAVLPETIELLLVALALSAAVRYWKRPQGRTAGELGGYLALAILTRSELILLIFLVGVPLVVLVGGRSPTGRLKHLAIMVSVIVVFVGPWVGRNLVTFHHPEVLSSEGGVTLETANCNATYYGPAIGSWSFACDNAQVRPGADESDMDLAARQAGEHYIETHKARLVEVVAVRVLRVWNIYRPFQQAAFDESNARPLSVSEAGTISFYILAPFAAGGLWALHRRRVPVFPLVALLATATLAGAAFFANGRYRAEGDLAVAILAGIGIDVLVGHYLRRVTAGQSADGER